MHETHIMIGMNTDGRSRLSRILVNGSKTEYDTKKIERVALYCPVVMLWRLFCSPSIFALPILVRSKKASKYKIQSCCYQHILSFSSLDLKRVGLTQGINVKSSFHKSFRSSENVSHFLGSVITHIDI
jgi:hypothetical protein